MIIIYLPKVLFLPGQANLEQFHLQPDDLKVEDQGLYDTVDKSF